MFVVLTLMLHTQAPRPYGTTEDSELLVIYSYYQAIPPLASDEENLVFFANTGVYGNDARVLYLFVVACDAERDVCEDTFRKSLPTTVFLASNVHVVWVPNGLYDLCNYKTAFQLPLFKDLATKVSRFFLLNASVRGPFLPLYNAKMPWWAPFLTLMDETVSLVGPYLNCEIAPHIQSFALLIDSKGLEIAEKTWYCPSKKVRSDMGARIKWVADTEVALSRRLLEHGRSFKTLLAAFYGVEGGQLGRSIRCDMKNPTLHDNYFGAHPHPYEVIFYKSGGDVLREKAMPSHESATSSVH